MKGFRALLTLVLAGALHTQAMAACAGVTYLGVGTSGSTTSSFTTTGPIASGALIVVGATINTNTVAPTSVSDNSGATGTWNALTASPAGTERQALFYKVATGLIGTGTVISANYTGGTTGTKLAFVATLTGAAASPLDQETNVADNFNNTLTTTAANPAAQASEAVFGMFTAGSSSVTVTEDATYFSLSGQVSGTSIKTGLSCKIVASLTAPSYGATTSANTFQGRSLASFKLSAAAATNHNLLLMGVGQ